MNSRHRIISASLGFWLFFTSSPVYANNEAVILGPEDIYLKPGEISKIELETENFDTDNQISWKLEYADNNCVTLDNDGTVHAENSGSALVSATLDNGNQKSIQVHIADDPESIFFREKYIQIPAGYSHGTTP